MIWLYFQENLCVFHEVSLVLPSADLSISIPGDEGPESHEGDEGDEGHQCHLAFKSHWE